MKQSAGFLFAACLTTIAAVCGSSAVGAEDSVATQELARPVASGKVTAAFWSRQTDSYSLHVVVPPFIGNTIACLRGLDPSFGSRTVTRQEGRMQVAPAANPVPSISADEISQPGTVSVADAMLRLVPQNIATYQPVMVGAPADFTGAPMGTIQRQPRIVQVWLLRADGTQILPVSRSDDSAQKRSCEEIDAAFRARTRLTNNQDFARRSDNEITYRFPATDSEQAVAAAIRIDDEYYIEKLRPLELKQPGN